MYQQRNQKLIDEKYCLLALNLSTQNINLTAENPSVGCVIVKDNIILSTGVTSESGRPHAEIVAIEKIVDKKILAGATIYVTLEPCCHFGKTAPCVNEIIKHKFARVVICSIDPDPKVDGKGVEILKKSGIEIEVGIFEKISQEINRGFFKAKLLQKPFTTLKIATSLDGKIATKNLQSKWISSQKSRDFAHILRSQHQSILVGANTVKQDNPRLNCRISGLEKKSPTPLIISKNLDFTFEENILKNNRDFNTIIICPDFQKNHPLLTKWRLFSDYNQAIFCDYSEDKIILEDALKKIQEHGINSVLIEGGESIITQFLTKNLVDELIWVQAPIIIGNDGKSAIGSLNIGNLSDAIGNFSLKNTFNFENDVAKVFRKNSN